jgi:uncharacterized protein (TIGR00299 family) protein
MLAYFDCFSGISGDMTLGALIHLGVPVSYLSESIRALPLTGFDITVHDVAYHGIQAKRVEVAAHGEHAHRRYADIRRVLGESPLPENAKCTALEIFRRLAEAEASVHGCEPDEVHFHEVGAVDAIVDVVGSALALDHLGVFEAVAAPVPTGRGFVDCRHGRLPVPAPATAALLKGVPVYGGNAEFELTTPTGAAILTTVAGRFGSLPAMTVRGVGYGAGSRDLKPGPNLLRIVIGEPLRAAGDAGDDLPADRVMIVEAAIDDMNPEIFGYAMDRLFAEGALDVLFIPVHMKKNRPGTLLQALCHPVRLEAVIRTLLAETTTLGVRYHEAGRRFLPREEVAIDTSFGRVALKQVRHAPGEVRLVPEFEVCKRIALERKIPIREVYDTITREAAATRGQKK